MARWLFICHFAERVTKGYGSLSADFVCYTEISRTAGASVKMVTEINISQ